MTRRDFYGLQVRHLVRFILLFVAIVAFAGTPKVAAGPDVVVFVEGQGTLPGSRWPAVRVCRRQSARPSGDTRRDPGVQIHLSEGTPDT